VLEEIVRCKKLFRFVRHVLEFKSCFTFQSITNGLPYGKPNLQVDVRPQPWRLGCR
jgi:hypothetical protein